MRRDLWTGLALAVITLLVYLPVRNHDFIFYDDPQFITENPQIQSGLSWNTIRYAFTTPVAGNWHPVTTLSHALDCELFGVSPGAQHLVNVLIHAANALLLFLLLQQWVQTASTGEAARLKNPAATAGFLAVPWTALFATLLFALHPLRVESVAWIAERKDVLSGFFFLLTLWFYTRYTQAAAGPNDGRLGDAGAGSGGGATNYTLALVSFGLGLMSKPMLVTVPFVLLLIDFWPLRRLQWPLQKGARPSLPTLLGEKILFLLLAAIDCGITVTVQRHAGAMQVIQHVSLSERLSNAVVSCLRYLGKLFWPADLAIVYPHPARHYLLTDQWPGWQIGAGAAALILISVLAVIQLQRRPYLAVGWFWFVGMLVPVIGLVQVGEQAMADRYTYLPAIGLGIALAWGLNQAITSVSETGNRTIPVWAVATLVVAAGLSCVTEHQLGYWQNTVSLFEHAIAVTADNPSAQFAVGVGLEGQGETSKAMVRYRVAVAIDTNYAKAYYNMGQAFRKTGKWPEATHSYLEAARSNPNDVATQLNLAAALSRMGQPRDALTHFNAALRLEPDSTEGLNNLAWLLSTCADPVVRDGKRAVELAEKACALTNFKMPVFVGTLAAAYAEAGRFGEAVTTAQTAASLAMQTGDSNAASSNQELLKLYAANKPYREEVQNGAVSTNSKP
ncbi:MAG TPA: tetratricopeptide repeat protein [Verrucomicrobiae bacterium]|nr:tetratricopeptide repeat protein [Verrucomicrobiae bacterium]